MPHWYVAPKLKLFYVLGSIFSALQLMFLEVLAYVAGVAAYVYSSGATYFSLYLVSSTACKLSEFIAIVGDAGASFVALQLSLERFIVVIFPFTAYMFTVRRSAVGCCSMLLTLAGINSCIIYAYSLHSYPAGNQCTSSPDTNSLASVILRHRLRCSGIPTVARLYRTRSGAETSQVDCVSVTSARKGNFEREWSDNNSCRFSGISSTLPHIPSFSFRSPIL